MLTQNQESLLSSLYEMKNDINNNINYTEDRLLGYKEHLQTVESAIVNLEAEREID